MQQQRHVANHDLKNSGRRVRQTSQLSMPRLILCCAVLCPEADEYQDRLKEVEDVCGPVMAHAHQAGGGGGGGVAGGSDDDLQDHDEL